MDDELDNNELISALADGQLEGAAFARAVETACADGQALATWHSYHVIGEALRGSAAAPGTPAPVFLEKISARLAREQQPAAVTPVAVAPIVVHEAANDGTFRWKLVAGLASFAAVAAVGWSVIGAGGGSAPAQPQLARAPAQPQAQALAAATPAAAASTVLARGDNGSVMIRDARLDEMLAAHRQFGGASALQMPAGFLRNATFEQPAR